MILTALTQYYERLANTEDGPKVPVYGFSEEKIGCIFILSEQGVLVDVVPHLTDEKKPRPKLVKVPRPEKRTSGIKPNFLWDKTAYVLGLGLPKDKKSETAYELCLPTFEAFKTFHIKLLQGTEDPALKALFQFLTSWQPENIESSEQKQKLLDCLDANVVFRLDGIRQFVHESTEAKTIWSNLIKPEDAAKTGMCLITGREAPIARLHPAIKGVAGGQSSGMSIVSFNKESFASFGKEQGDNAPVSDQAAFAYTTALNYLLRRENKQVISLGDTSLVFWALADQTKQAEQSEDLFLSLVNPPSVTDESETADLRPELQKIAKGCPLQEIAPELDPDTRFFILGLAPNASRLSIRFWLQTSFGEICERLAQHFQDLALEPIPWKTPPSIWRLLVQLVPHREAKQNKIEDAPAHLAGEFMRSVFTGLPYPQAILTQLIARFRADGDINGIRVAMVKAVLQRSIRKLNKNNQEKIPMSLDKDNTNAAYLLGRLFAVLETIQRGALGSKVNATIADKYYASASTVPYSVYPRLLSGSKHHLSKIRKEKPGWAVNLDKELVAVISLLPTEFPRHLSIEDQGRFSIGYYHQKNEHFTNLKEESTENTTQVQGDA